MLRRPPVHPVCPRGTALLIAVLAAVGTLAPVVLAEDEAVRGCATKFGQALERGDAAAMRPILPSRGKVQMRLAHLGPGDGDFSASQVEALFNDFLKQGAVKGFEVFRVEHDSSGYALVRSRAVVIDRAGRESRIAVHLALQPEGDRWVLTGIREHPGDR